jgi:hypothetical protein
MQSIHYPDANKVTKDVFKYCDFNLTIIKIAIENQELPWLKPAMRR